MKNKGWIALDVDGTLTAAFDSIPAQVTQYLEQLAGQGWNILILTGRALSICKLVTSAFTFPYFLGVQNGADILKMPEEQLLQRQYLTSKEIANIEEIYQGKEDLIIYSGYEKGDFCYYRPERFSQTLLTHLTHLQKQCPVPWKEVNSFDFSADFAFPLIKCFGHQEHLRIEEEKLNKIPSLQAAMIGDPIGKVLHFNLVTHFQATKGQALKKIIGAGARGKIIAAGDDRNDLSMFAEADVSIVMETAPKDVLAKADIIASAAAKCGIIAALEKAIHQ